MRRILAAAIVCWALALGMTVLANEKPTPEYQKAMKDLNAANGSARQALKDLDYETAEKNAVTLKAAFAVVVAYWEEKKVEDALALAKAGLKGAEALEVAAKAKNIQEALDAQAAMAGSPSSGTVGSIGTCAPCHLAHRARMPDGTFEVK